MTTTPAMTTTMATMATMMVEMMVEMIVEMMGKVMVEMMGKVMVAPIVASGCSGSRCGEGRVCLSSLGRLLV